MTRQIWSGDNLEMLESLDRASVGLAYLDPPFNSGRAYDARVGASSSDSLPAFDDTWRWGDEVERQLQSLGELMPHSGASMVSALVASLGPCDMSAYLVMMAPRLASVRRALADDGSLFVHCDPSASHYLKILLDAIVGPGCFRNEIVWKRTHAHSGSKRFGPVHDVILYYAMSKTSTWNQGFAPYDQEYLDKYFTHEDDRGRYQLITCTAPGPRPGTRAHYEWRGVLPPTDRHWAWTKDRMEELDGEGRLVHSPSGVPRLKRYVSDGQGVRLQDVWLDINPLGAHSRERTGYETQKPVELLERIVACASAPGDLVVDPFGGSGTTAVAAEQAGRSWVVADRSLLASSLSLARARSVAEDAAIELIGFPASESESRELLQADPNRFAVWATAMLGTVLDRKQTTTTLALGSRQSAGDREPALRSWVPLDGRRLAVPPTEDLSVRQHHLVLGSSVGATRLSSLLERSGATHVRLVDPSEVVSSEARRTGGIITVAP